MRVTTLVKPVAYGLRPNDKIVIAKLFIVGENVHDYVLRYPYQDFCFINENVDKIFLDKKNAWHVLALWDKKSDKVLLHSSEGPKYSIYVTQIDIGELKEELEVLISKNDYEKINWEEMSEEEYDS